MHIPVLLKETIEILNPEGEPSVPYGAGPQEGKFFIDGTIGGGGHAIAILEKIGPKGKLLGIDWDENNIKKLIEIKKLRNYENLILVHGNYADLPEILKQKKLGRANGLILDLGFSSESLESGRGFSFQKDEPLDMRYQFQDVRRPEISQYFGRRTSQILTAAEVVNTFSEKDLAEIFWKYGEERFSRQIAKKIIEQRKKKPIKTTFDLVEIIKKLVPRNYERGRINPATKVFQALRIYVNDELGNLEKLLKNIGKIVKGRARLRPRLSQDYGGQEGFGGRVVIISYHSLEDRLVKNCFRDLKNQGKAQILTGKPITPTLQEIQANPRSRSAKLRAILLSH